MKTYQAIYKFYYKGKLAKSSYSGMCLADEIPANETVTLTWDDADYFFHRFGLIAPFNIYHLKKGRKICFFDIPKAVKEWKTKETGIEVTKTCIPYEASIKEILSYHDGEAAIKYLIERGLKVLDK